MVTFIELILVGSKLFKSVQTMIIIYRRGNFVYHNCGNWPYLLGLKTLGTLTYWFQTSGVPSFQPIILIYRIGNFVNHNCGNWPYLLGLNTLGTLTYWFQTSGVPSFQPIILIYRIGNFVDHNWGSWPYLTIVPWDLIHWT